MVKYVYDSKGKKTGVIIPIDVWEKTKSKIIAMENKNEFRPSCLHHELVLVTRNEKDFKDISGLEIYNPYNN